METKINSRALKAEALHLGFSACGIAPAGPADPIYRDFLREWLGPGRHAEMAYMDNHFDRRCDPVLLVEDTRCTVSVTLNYYPATRLPESECQFAWYVYGMDYHDLMHGKLTTLFRFIQEPDVSGPDGRVFCDTAPVPKRYWVWHAGLEWIGKNTRLITSHAGSAFFLRGLFLNTEADTYDRPRPNRCGTCNRCLQACPTQTLEAPYGLDARRCLSYLTIENKGKIPASISPLMGNHVCEYDECQRAYPWSRFAAPCRTSKLQPPLGFIDMKKEDWQQLSEGKYRTLFEDNAVKRTEYSGLIRDIKQIKD